jgi:AraC-like DNA-binding protein
MAGFSFLSDLLSFFVAMLQRLKLPASLDGMAWRYANPAGANRRHHHAELELNLVTRGAGTYLLGNRHYQIRRGDLLWLFPTQEHVLIEQTPDFEMWIVIFRRRLIKRSATDPASVPLQQRSFAGDTCRRLRPRDLSRFEELFAQLAHTADEPGLLNAGLAYALLHAWKCFDRAGEVPARNVHPAVERTARLLLSDETSYSLPQLARRAGLSSSRLSRLFKQQTGLSIVEFRNRQRMQRFLDRFESERNSSRQSTLLNAALDAGFGSYPQFHRVFRRVAGCSPAEYQRRHAS